MKLGKYVLIGLLVVLTLCGNLSGSAYAAQFKLAPHPHFWFNKGLKVHKPKKLRNSKSRFRSPVTGNMIYGKAAKKK